MKKSAKDIVAYWVKVCGSGLTRRISSIHWHFFHGQNVYSRDDLYQDTLLRLLSYTGYTNVQHQHEFEALFYRTAYNQAINMLEKAAIRQRHHNAVLAQQELQPEEDNYAELRAALALASVSLLPPKQQQIVYLWCEGIGHQEIAAKMQMNYSTTRVQYHHAKNTLAAHAQQYLN